MPKTQSFNSNSEIYTYSWKNSGLDLQVVQKDTLKTLKTKKLNLLLLEIE